MKKIAIISASILVSTAVIVGCSDKRSRGRTYMPDMGESRAYETYAERDSTKFTADPNNKGGLIYYDNRPVSGTMRRGEELPYTMPNDSNGYKMSATVKNPLETVSAADLAEAGRLFNINCGICHGAKGTGNGPIASKIGAVANLTLDQYKIMADGTMFHSITYGKNSMGSYASQLDRRQRWMIVKYIRTLQPNTAPAAGTADSTAKAKTVAATTDSTAKKAK